MLNIQKDKNFTPPREVQHYVAHGWGASRKKIQEVQISQDRQSRGDVTQVESNL
jgi:hypothetical protein